MSNLEYPTTDEYNLPKKNILVLSCMDLRLTDNLVDFLNFDNLHNRYDHFILAGTSLLTTQTKKHWFKKDIYKNYSHWNATLHNHIDIAKKLHHIEDIYIIEHQDCGAYDKFLNHNKVDINDKESEIKCHREFAHELAETIRKEHKLHVHCFFIDLRGNVKVL